ncbi:uncharacterized protein LOC129583294 [Paramacrobiotus metropolitanus]|uniref:uncharacterized protein LOC129583294 n=1 Tax=Paramacrobiotus metropolitanus TaxID=2943436 RepID=UPI0024457AA5|nr:uncharacterized protein LOC129583294 [Paramacrobiotus metropolitanus]XP_055331027.1 uncharacterized protein LOC129583294 [Paramacrobiotus metropolitanus]XP_055331028.1 uncharacterized protein LOC129583294 [Paramacrobiotus metropolitanus]XP_055331029.1 uncharacterized protein LOC129583294 [Paramacrobiotus metropolitanus]
MQSMLKPNCPFQPPHFDHLTERYASDPWNTWTIDGFLMRLLAEWPATAGLKPAVTCRSRNTNFLQLDITSDAWMRKLHHHHQQPARIAVAMDPSLHFPSIILGILKCGASYLPISSDWTDPFIQKVLAYSQPSMLICDDVERYSKLSTTLPCLDCSNGLIINTDYSGKSPFHKGRSALDPAATFVNDLEKVTLCTHRALTEHVVKNWEILPLTDDEVLLSKATAVNTSESLLEVLASVLSGHRLHILPLFVRRDPEKLLDILLEFNVRRLWLHPNYLLRLCKILTRRKQTFSAALRLITITSPRIPLDIAVLFFQAFSNVKLAVCQRMQSGNSDQLWDVFDNHRDLLKAFYEDTVPPSILLRNFDLPINSSQSVSVRKDTCGGIYVCGKLAGDPALNYVITKTDAGWVQCESTGTIDASEFLQLFAGMPASKRISTDEPVKKPVPPKPTIPTPRPIDYVVEDINEDNMDDVIEFLVRNTLMVSMSDAVPVPSFSDLQLFTRVVLEESNPKELLFVLRRKNETKSIIAVNVAFDAHEKSVNLQNLTSPDMDPKNQVLAWTLLPLLSPLVNRAGVTVESYMMSVDFMLEKQQRFQLACQMDLELSKRAQRLDYKYIITKNYDGFSRSVSKMSGYERRASFQLNRLTLPDGSVPFENYPASSRMTLNVLILTSYHDGIPNCDLDSTSQDNTKTVEFQI